MPSVPYALRHSAESKADIKRLKAFDRTKVLAGIDIHLRGEPTNVSQTRIKQMEQPFWSQYRLRIDAFRVYYDVDEQDRIVRILRIIEKGRNETPKEANHDSD